MLFYYVYILFRCVYKSELATSLCVNTYICPIIIELTFENGRPIRGIVCWAVCFSVLVCCSVLHPVAVSNGRPIRGIVRWDPTGPWQYKILKIQRYGDNYSKCSGELTFENYQPILDTRRWDRDPTCPWRCQTSVWSSPKSALCVFACCSMVQCVKGNTLHHTCNTKGKRFALLAMPDVLHWHCSVLPTILRSQLYVHQSGLQCAAVCCSVSPSIAVAVVCCSV